MKDTSGPAFPTKQYNRNIMQFEITGGMTLRDYFAAKAMQGLISNPRTDGDLMLGKAAYTVADAMLKAREQ